MLDKRSLKQQLIAHVQQQIISGVYKPDQRITEQEISQQYGVSRSIVRETFITLETQGLLVSVPYMGIKVASVSPQEIEHLLLPLRAHIECYALNLIEIDRDFIDKLTDALNNMKAAVLHKDMGEFNVADLAFHQVIIDEPNSAAIKSVWHSIDQQARMHLALQTSLSGNLEEFLQDHIELLETIKHKDKEQAIQTLHAHIVDKNIPLLTYIESYQRRLYD